MSVYRDDLAAAHERIAALERDLAATLLRTTVASAPGHECYPRNGKRDWRAFSLSYWGTAGMFTAGSLVGHGLSPIQSAVLSVIGSALLAVAVIILWEVWVWR